MTLTPFFLVNFFTKLLCELKTGDNVNILGPLGRGFKIDKKTKKHILIAGGHGVAPILLLAYNLKKLKKEIIVLIGAKNKDLILCKNEFKELGAVVKISTEDGSSEHKGFVTDLLKKKGSESFFSTSSVYVCGPMPMLKEVSGIVRKHKISAQLSLEGIMGCGIGVCLSCVCKSRKTEGSDFYKLTCSDGPVFSSEDIVL